MLAASSAQANCRPCIPPGYRSAIGHALDREGPAVKLVFNRGYLGVFLAVLAAEAVIALFVDDWLVRPYGGDALSVVFVFTFVKAFYDATSRRVACAALGIACAVEIG